MSNDYWQGRADEDRLRGLDLESERADVEPIPDICEAHGRPLLLSGDCPVCLDMDDARRRSDHFTPYKPAA